MAVRENRAMQASMVLMVVVIVALAVTTCIFYSQLQSERDRAAALIHDLDRAERQQAASQGESGALKEMVGGYSDKTSLANIQFDHESDASDVFPVDERPKVPAYRTMVAHLLRSLRTAAQREVDALQRERAREQQLEGLERQYEANLDVRQRANADLTKELAGVRQRFYRTQDEYIQKWKALVAQLNEKEAQLVDWEMKNDRVKKSFNRELARWQRRYELMRERWEDALPDKEFVAPLGRVTHVNGRTRTVTIDLGRADLLPRGLSLSVFAGPTDNVAGQKPKGKIEILRLVDDHAAEARVVEDRLSNLILPGDVVYTPVWKVGGQRRFALVGRMDIDGDGEDDLDQVRQLIERGGGQVDAVVDRAGKQTGEITLDTWFVIVGKLSSGRREGDDLPEAVSRILDQADELGVDRMSLERFLETVGYDPGPAAEQLSAFGRQRQRPDSTP
jgi:hypothetical protein